MHRPITGKILALLFAAGTAGSAVAASPLVGTGDGMGIVDTYDGVQKTLAVGRQRLRLSPGAATSLEQQLAEHRMSAAHPFAAKFSVVPSGDGTLLIDSIYVVPPKGP